MVTLFPGLPGVTCVILVTTTQRSEQDGFCPDKVTVSRKKKEEKHFIFVVLVL